jgi:hypothetical protein
MHLHCRAKYRRLCTWRRMKEHLVSLEWQSGYCSASALSSRTSTKILYTRNLWRSTCTFIFLYFVTISLCSFLIRSCTLLPSIPGQSLGRQDIQRLMCSSLHSPRRDTFKEPIHHFFPPPQLLPPYLLLLLWLHPCLTLSGLLYCFVLFLNPPPHCNPHDRNCSHAGCLGLLGSHSQRHRTCSRYLRSR